MADCCFTVGDKFSSYDELREKISQYEQSRSVQLNHNDSRTLESARKRVPRKVEKANKALVYHYINFSCVFGGKQYRCKGHGRRPHHRVVISVGVCVGIAL